MRLRMRLLPALVRAPTIRTMAATMAATTTTTAHSDIAYGPGPLRSFDLHVPADHSGPPRPLVCFVHGGAWRS